ncbi:hypothetical protein TWF679_002274 [Orbilia oligospora]|uniref:Blue (type 1) copper domain-containing protein n=1 Tax=Orbilia oligospora TaxID=2813651 RepID=A0A8H8VGD0_ORBOL|nr:hypothetical protein TWF679_002274 [Orbilia oligospora]
MRLQLALIAGLLSSSALAYGDEDWGNRGPKAKTIVKYVTRVQWKTKTCTVTKIKTVMKPGSGVTKTQTEVQTVTVTATAAAGGKDGDDKEEEEEPVKVAEKPAKAEDDAPAEKDEVKEDEPKEDEAKDEPKDEPKDEAKPAPKTHIIKAMTDDDGNDVFEPASLMAATGDTVVFEFHPSTHSVARGIFDKPCQPLEKGGFYSGFLRVSGGAKSPTFSIKVEDSNPIWYYCTVGKHCQGGMVGVINPGPKDDLKAYIAASKKAPSNVSPKEVNGGTVASPKMKRILRA